MANLTLRKEIKNITDQIDSELVNFKSQINEIKQSQLDGQTVKSIEQNLKFFIIIKIIGSYERLIVECMYILAKEKNSPLFHSYLYNNIDRSGKSWETDQINGFFKSIKLPQIKKDLCNRDQREGWTSLDTLYANRHNLAHGNFNCSLTVDEIIYLLEKSKIFIIEQVIKTISNAI